jgi:branched-chain amino acid aminotransferase
MTTAMPWVYLNDRFVPWAEAGLPLHDAGVVQGVTVTDLARTFRHRLFRFADHVQRFRHSASLAEVPLRQGNDELTRLALELVERNARLLPLDQDLALVLLATPGPVGYYLGETTGPGEATPTLVMHTFPLPFARYARLFQEGARLVVPSIRQVPAACVDPRIKHRSRMHWWLADREAQRLQPGATALLENEAGQVTETAAANLLLVREGTILTPPRGTVLPGVSLQVTQELCGHLGIPFVEQPLTLEDCRQAREALLCSTPYGVAGVRQIQDNELAWPGPLTTRLRQAWNDLVGLDIREQILSSR